MSYWHDDPTTHPPIGTWMWHLHHEVLCEPLTEPLARRLAYIREFKPKAEQAIRLGAIDVVRGELPPEFDEARAALDEAEAVYANRAALNEAEAVYVKAEAAAQPALEILHAVEHPDCPWNQHPGSIFGDKP